MREVLLGIASGALAPAEDLHDTGRRKLQTSKHVEIRLPAPVVIDRKCARRRRLAVDES